MKMTRHGNNLIELTRFPLLFPISSYLVREDDGLTLIDTGMSGSASAIVDAAKEVGDQIVRIALTHSHGDHAGSLEELHVRLRDAEIIVGNREARLLAGDRTLEPSEPDSKLRGSYLTCEVNPTWLVAEGDRIGSLEVIEAPGHTPGHIAFLDTRDRTLIAGDAFQTRGGVAVSGKLRPFFPFPALATWDKPTALATARKLRGLNPSRLAVGHGPVLNDPGVEMDRAIDEAAASFGSEAARVA